MTQINEFLANKISFKVLSIDSDSDSDITLKLDNPDRGQINEDNSTRKKIFVVHNLLKHQLAHIQFQIKKIQWALPWEKIKFNPLKNQSTSLTMYSTACHNYSENYNSKHELSPIKSTELIKFPSSLKSAFQKRSYEFFSKFSCK